MLAEKSNEATVINVVVGREFGIKTTNRSVELRKAGYVLSREFFEVGKICMHAASLYAVKRLLFKRSTIVCKVTNPTPKKVLLSNEDFFVGW